MNKQKHTPKEESKQEKKERNELYNSLLLSLSLSLIELQAKINHSIQSVSSAWYLWQNISTSVCVCECMYEFVCFKRIHK